jgi:hypothetical protein
LYPVHAAIEKAEGTIEDKRPLENTANKCFEPFLDI